MAGEVIATDLYVIVGPSGAAMMQTISTSQAAAWQRCVSSKHKAPDIIAELEPCGYRCVPVEIVRRGEATGKT